MSESQLFEVWVRGAERPARLAAFTCREEAFERVRALIAGGDLRTLAVREPAGLWHYYRTPVAPRVGRGGAGLRPPKRSGVQTAVGDREVYRFRERADDEVAS